ncbi:uncharacterized protein LOC129613305 [Condylostylus longicornis]|uniref:uncharacterized protein LOC129613305 n=1 Tax=Condylostylus longicornis TaxID=2530218 RepID=UPI00244E52E9|nr:uncharacterized protein LOC129613305 [Condylostylus longicornis]
MKHFDEEKTQNKFFNFSFPGIYQYDRRKYYKFPVLKIDNFNFESYPLHDIEQPDDKIKIAQYDIVSDKTDAKFEEEDEYNMESVDTNFYVRDINEKYLEFKQKLQNHKDSLSLEDSEEYSDNDKKPFILSLPDSTNTDQNDYSSPGITMRDIEFFQNYYSGHSAQLRTNAVFPGTIWCGPGNKAPSDNTFGIFFRTDLCCRDHDRCFDIIPPRTRKYGLYNDGMFTKSHCDCDLDFYVCLKNVNSFVSNKVGFAYFNVYRPKCFRKEYPVIRCVQWFNNRCQLYLLDESREDRYQWFDNRHF